MEKFPQGELHIIEDDLSETWIEDWAAKGVEAIEDYLQTSNQAKFLMYLSQLENPALEQ